MDIRQTLKFTLLSYNYKKVSKIKATRDKGEEKYLATQALEGSLCFYESLKLAFKDLTQSEYETLPYSNVLETDAPDKKLTCKKKIDAQLDLIESNLNTYILTLNKAAVQQKLPHFYAKNA